MGEAEGEVRPESGAEMFGTGFQPGMYIINVYITYREWSEPGMYITAL